jgi:hypothetical protein
MCVTVMNVAFAVGRCCVRQTGRRRNAAAYGEEVSVPALERSNGNSDWWYMYTSTTFINNGDPCAQREYAAETVCCDRANLRALRVRCTRKMLAHVLGHNFAPLAFQKPRLALLADQTVLYTFICVLVRPRPFGGTMTSRILNNIGVRAFIRRNAAAYGVR